MFTKLKLAAVVSATVLLLGLLVRTGSASTGAIYLSPSSASVLSGNNITLSLRINPGGTVDSVQANVNYNASQLQFISSSLGTFSTCVKNSGGGGVVELVCTELGGGTSSDSLIANITFKALVGSGSDGLSVSGANAADNGTYTNPSSSGATVSFTSPAPAPVSSGSSGSSYHSNNTSSSAPKTPSAPAPKPVTVTATSAKPQLSEATVTTSVSSAASVYVEYGANKNNLDQKSQTVHADQNTPINLSGLTPGTTYYYRIVAINADGSLSKGPIKTLSTSGFTISVTVLDAHFHPLTNQKVTLHSAVMTAVTDSKGTATFKDVAPGQHHLEYTIGSHSYSQPVYVANAVTSSKNTQSAPAQAAAVVLQGYTKPTGTSLPILTAVALVVVDIVGVAIYIKRKLVMSWLARAKPYMAERLRRNASGKTNVNS